MLTPCPLFIDDCHLKTNRIDIWQFPLSIECPEAFSLLNASERNRAQRFYFPKHQRRFTNAHSVLRLILARYLNRSPTELEFTAGPQGKPGLLNNPVLQFNLSHSRDMALLAIGKHHPLGVDLEYFSARPYQGIAKQLFSNQEIQALQHASKAVTPLVFFNIWAQKEAFIKACGLGLSYPTQQFDVPILSQTPQIIVDHLHNKTWQIVSFTPEAGCCASLCYEPSVQDIRYSRLSNDGLQQLSALFKG